MPTDPDCAARARIAAAYDPARFADAGRQVIELLSNHLASVQQSREQVLHWREPMANRDEAKVMLDGTRREGPEAFSASLAELVKHTLSRGQTLHDPRYIGHQVPPPIPMAGLFEAVSAVTNQAMAIYEMGPWATGVEEAMVQTLGEALGFAPGVFTGFVTSGGSLANLTALLTARNAAMAQAWRQGMTQARPRPVIIASGESHYCVARSAGILGIGSDNVARAPVDHRLRMDPSALEALLADLKRKGTTVIAVVASACSTRTGAFDPLEAISGVCASHGAWLHVDAAHGGAACLSDRYRHLIRGIEHADSVVWDAHKMLHVPALCTFVFYRDKRHRSSAFEQDAPYLYDPTVPHLAEHDSGLATMECTKRAAALGLWGTWCLFGRGLFRDIVETTFDMGRRFWELLSEADDFIALHEPMCNIIMFRHLPPLLRGADAATVGAFQFQLRRRVIEAGRYYLVPGKWDGQGALRCVITNPLTTVDHLRGLMAELREQGRELLQ
jgi:L-2,4-diaminobutyrate decarboxylase